MKKFETAEEDEPPTLSAGPTRTVRRTGRRRPPFGSYMDADLQKRLKIWCVTNDVEMQDALDAAVRAWLDSKSES
ncbi:hypothetical protein [Streptomyces sp. NPDC006638]|uniref:hypothetical protein n=1 Tax=Streptomyces sp. NPDC006638 TaxID=3157183 RepID=UPI0033B1699D